MESRAMEGNEKGKSSLLEVISYYGVPYPNPPGFSSREEGSYKGAKSNLCEEGKGNEQRASRAGRRRRARATTRATIRTHICFGLWRTMICSGLWRTRAKTRAKVAKVASLRPLADNGKDKGKGCNGGKHIDILTLWSGLWRTMATLRSSRQSRSSVDGPRFMISTSTSREELLGWWPGSSRCWIHLTT